MIDFQIKNRFTGDVQFTAQIDCDDGALTGVKIGLAVKWTIKSGADLSRASLFGASLFGASLSRANLSGADLSRASLSGADLFGAKIGPHTIARKVAQICRDDGYEFIGFALDDGGLLIRAGCQTRLIGDYRQHVADAYPGTLKAIETLAILDFIQARADAGKVAA